MHFVCSTFGSSGDVFPMLGLALQLRQRGHQITFATNEHFQSIVNSYDLAFEQLGSEESYQAAVGNPDLWKPRQGFRHVVQSLQPALKRQYDIHADLARKEQIVALTNCFGMGARIAQEKLGIPVITVHLQPAVLWSRFEPPTLPGLFGPNWLKDWLYRFAVRTFLDPAICPFLNSWRHELHLPPIKRITDWWNSPQGILCLFPEWYCKPQPDWPANVVLTDFPLWNHQSDAPIDPAIDAFLNAGEAPIVFTPGTANLHGKKFFRSAVAACQKLNQRGILLTGFPEQIPTELPETVRHFSYVPLDLLLPRAAAFVHHGGVGSTSQAMLAGIPQVVMPLAHDQFDNAARITRQGIGNSIPEARFTANRLATALGQLLDNQSVKVSCQTIARRLEKRAGLSRSADAVEAFCQEF